jgi:putative phosphoribosyl transferase
MSSQAAGLNVPAHPSGMVVISPASRAVAEALGAFDFATLLLDLQVDEEDAHDIGLLARRVLDAIDWARRQPRLEQMPVALFGGAMAAPAALVAAAERLEVVHALISHDGRPDLAGAALERVEAPTLLIVDAAQHALVDMNRHAMHRMRSHAELELATPADVPGLTAEWCQRYLWSMA